MSDPLETVKREQERTREALADAKQQLSTAMDEKTGPPAEDPDQAREQLRSLRASIERDLSTLRARTPPTDQLIETVRPAAIAVGGGLATVALVARRMSTRKARREHERRLREQATALAEAFARLDLEGIAAEAEQERAEDEEGGKGKVLLLALAAALAGGAAWWRARTREEPDIWGTPTDEPLPPPSDPLTTGRPATPEDVTAEVPTIPIERR